VEWKYAEFVRTLYSPLYVSSSPKIAMNSSKNDLACVPVNGIGSADIVTDRTVSLFASTEAPKDSDPELDVIVKFTS